MVKEKRPEKTGASNSADLPASEAPPRDSARAAGVLLKQAISPAILDAAPEVFLLLDGDGQILDVSERVFPLLGYSPAELLHTNLTAIVSGEHTGGIGDFLASVIRLGTGSRPHELKLLNREGEGKWIEVTASRITTEHDSECILAIARDVTNRKRTEETLRGSDKFFRALFDYSPEVIFVLDSDGHILDTNDRAVSLSGYHPEEIIGRNFLDTLDEENAAKTRGALKQIEKREMVDTFELRMRTKSGDDLWMDMVGVRIEKSGQESIIFCIATDTTGRKQAEKALKESEQRFRTLFDRSLEMFLVSDINGRFLDANDRALALVGYQRSDIPKVAYPDLLDEADLPRAYQNLLEILEHGSDRETHEYRVKTKSGECVWIETSGVRMDRGAQPPAIIQTS